MADPTPQAPAKTAPPAAPPAAGAAAPPAAAEAERDDSDRVGTILMAVALAALVVVVADVAMKGRLLAPLFALFPVPKSSTVEEGAPGGGAELPPEA